MNTNFCTISTPSHLFKCFALADSLAPFNGFLHILIVDAKTAEVAQAPRNVKFYFLNDLKSDISQEIKSKYASKTDKLRWSLKPVFLIFLLTQFEKVVYVDNDIFFYNDFNFLLEELNEYNILLTPHNYKRDTKFDQNWLEANFRVGLYNAGFVAVNKKAHSTLEWWADACLYRCEKNYWRGLFDDQKYLDLFPIIEPKTKILSHKGCNAAAWNRAICVRTYQNGKHLINATEPLIFYHFNYYSLQIISEEDILFKEYLASLKKYKKDLSSLFLEDKLNFTDKIKLGIWNVLNKMNQ